MQRYAKEDKINGLRGKLLLPYKDYSKVSETVLDNLIAAYTKQLAEKK